MVVDGSGVVVDIGGDGVGKYSEGVNLPGLEAPFALASIGALIVCARVTEMGVLIPWQIDVRLSQRYCHMYPTST